MRRRAPFGKIKNITRRAMREKERDRSAQSMTNPLYRVCALRTAALLRDARSVCTTLLRIHQHTSSAYLPSEPGRAEPRGSESATSTSASSMTPSGDADAASAHSAPSCRTRCTIHLVLHITTANSVILPSTRSLSSLSPRLSSSCRRGSSEGRQLLP